MGEEMHTEIKVFIADDHPIVRKGLKDMIEADPNLKVIGEAGDGETALAQLKELRPQVAVVDIDMPRLDGFGLVRELKKQRLPVEVIFLTMHSKEDLFNEAVNLGVKGYVLKDSAVNEIGESIKSVAAGQHYISPALSSYLINRTARADSLTQQKPALHELTPTERRIVKLIAEYKTSKEIADELGVHYRTIENHRTNICQKLNLHGSHALMKFALKHHAELL
jgi:DNA-binding NarL/FixJ family response regulator